MFANFCFTYFCNFLCCLPVYSLKEIARSQKKPPLQDEATIEEKGFSVVSFFVFNRNIQVMYTDY